MEKQKIVAYDCYNHKIIDNDLINTVVPQFSRNDINSNGTKLIHFKRGKIMKIRKPTPKECWRLMGYTDEDFERAEKVNTETQLYKQAGNSIVVNVLEAIFKEML